MLNRLCLFCSKRFVTFPYRIKDGRGKYCSKVCQYTDKRGKPTWASVHHKKGMTTNTGRTHFERGDPNISGENHRNWKGDDVGYSGVHVWVKKQLGKAFWCTFCFSMVNVEWANISHEYKRDLCDWLQLCRKCHIKFDRESGWGDAIAKFPYIHGKKALDIIGGFK